MVPGKQARESQYHSDRKCGARLATSLELVVMRKGWLGGTDQTCGESVKEQENRMRNIKLHKHEIKHEKFQMVNNRMRGRETHITRW